MAGAGGQEPRELAACFEFVHPADGQPDDLADLAIDPLVLDDLQVPTAA